MIANEANEANEGKLTHTHRLRLRNPTLAATFARRQVMRLSRSGGGVASSPVGRCAAELRYLICRLLMRLGDGGEVGRRPVEAFVSAGLITPQTFTAEQGRASGGGTRSAGGGKRAEARVP